MIQEAQVSPNDSQFYCCFGRCHALKGAKIIAIIFAVNYMLSALFSLVALANGYPTNTGVSLVGIIVVGCLWYGLTKEREGFLVPFLIYMIICLVMIGTALAVLLVFVPFVIIRGSAINEQELSQVSHEKGEYEPVVNFISENQSMLVPIVMVMLLGVALSFSLSMLIFCTVKKAYSYIKQKRWTVPNAATHMFVAVPMMEKGQAMKGGDMYPPAYEDIYRKN
uniref:Transmembrane protein n=1 Tax=Plectus sambesii TaxID=2011161 RepID=A0A914UPY4_9BILA